MAFVVKDRVKQTSTTTGTTTMVLSGSASVGYQSFSDALSDGDTTVYAITDANGNWETGLGTWTSSNDTLTRTTVYESSNSNNAVNFSSGTKNVFITSPASRSAIADQNGKTTFVDQIEVTGIKVYKSTDPVITLRNTTANASTVVQMQGDASGTMWLLADGMNQANNSRIIMAVDGLEKFRINGCGSGNGAWGLGGQNYGTAGQVITSNGSTSAPTWQTVTVDLSAYSTTSQIASTYSTTSSIASTYAPLSSPNLTGNPTVPTQSANNNSTRIASTEYVDSAVSNLVDSAPSTLNTLNELASALNDDPSFATTITTSIGTKLNLSGGTLTGDLDLGSNDLTTTGKILYSNYYATESALPSSSTYHGMGSHVHNYNSSGVGRWVFAHANAWHPVANLSEIANSSNWDSAYGWGNHASAGYLTGITGQSLYSLSNVFSSSSPSDGQVLTWDNSNSYWKPTTVSTGATGDISFSASTISSSGTTVTIDDILSVTGNVMIGTTSAGYPNSADTLTVSKNGNTTDNAGITIRAGTQGQSAIYFSDATGTASGTYQSYIYHDHSAGNFNIYTTDYIKLGTGGGERLRIGSSGQIGIQGANYGTNGQVLTSRGSSLAPTWQTVSGGGSSTGDISFSGSTITSSGSTVTIDDILSVTGTITGGSSITATTTINVGTNGGYYLKQDSSKSTIRSESQPIVLQTYASGSWNERLEVTNSGNVGVGVTPNAKFEIVGENNSSSTPLGKIANSQLHLDHTTHLNAIAQIGFGYTPSRTYSSASIGYISTSQASSGKGDLFFATRDVTTDSVPTERLRIGSAGQIGIGGANYGSAGQVLTSNGGVSAPSWQNASGGGSGVSVSDATALAFQCG